MEVDQNQVNVAKYIIKKTPIGHITKSLENLNIVLGEQVMDTDDVKKEIHKYGESHLSQIPNDVTNTKVVISGLTKDADGFYHDQGQKVKFKIGLGSGNVEEAGAEEPPQNELRDLIDAKIKVYLEENFKDEITKKNVYFDAAANKIVILISSHNLNLKSFWTGEWLSTWELDLNENKAKGNIKGNTYYYEEGNVQFNFDTNFDSTISGDDAEAKSKSMIEFIKKSENEIEIELDKVYDDLSDNYIKPLRRKIPVTGTKMNWSLNQVQFAQNEAK